MIIQVGYRCYVLHFFALLINGFDPSGPIKIEQFCDQIRLDPRMDSTDVALQFHITHL